jgi:Type VII secretion system ESX-1, transport TM domain B
MSRYRMASRSTAEFRPALSPATIPRRVDFATPPYHSARGHNGRTRAHHQRQDRREDKREPVCDTVTRGIVPSRDKQGPDYSPRLSTRTRVTGPQFSPRRTALALKRRRDRMGIELSWHHTLVVLIWLGVFLWVLLNQADQIGDSPIIADRDSGALYVRVRDTLYPALNLASAQLITGRPDNPHKVRSGTIAAQRHGPMVGIPGAPSGFIPTSPASSSWLVCDATTPAPGTAGAPQPVTVTVIDGAPDLSGRQRILGDADAVMLRYRGDAWMIRQGRRSRIDPTNRSVLMPLGLTPEQVNQAPPMSRALYDVLPVGPELSVYPDGPLNIVDMKDNPATCWWWEQATGADRAHVEVVSGPTVPVPAGDANKAVSLLKVDSSEREADRVYRGPGYANFVAITGNDPAAESMWWLSDSGVRFGVDASRETRSALGLTATPSPAPFAALRLLAPGPTLSHADALRQVAGEVQVPLVEQR